MGSEERQKWDLELISPLPWQDKVESQDVIDAEMAQFQTFMSQTS